jgi:hypothetical protein
MSAETLQFFEDKNTEFIINWMLSRLDEDQIRMCLDQAGIPDTSFLAAKAAATSAVLPVVNPGEAGPSSAAPPSAAAAAAASAAVAGPPAGSGGKSKIFGEAAAAAAGFLPPDASSLPSPSLLIGGGPKIGATGTFLKRYRTQCINTPYLIKTVTPAGVDYYEFKEVEYEDLTKNPTLIEGEAGWVYSQAPMKVFKNYCTGQDGDNAREIFGFLKAEYPEEFINAPAEVMAVASDYVSSGLVSPIPFPALEEVQETVEVSEPEQEVVVETTSVMDRAILIQSKSSNFIKDNYPELHSKGLTMYPIFIYGSEGSDILHLTAVVKDGKLELVDDKTKQALTNSSFKKKINSIQESIEAGLYVPSDNIREELNAALTDPELRKKIKAIYEKFKIEGVVYFGMVNEEYLQDSEEVLLGLPLTQTRSTDSWDELDPPGEEIELKQMLPLFSPTAAAPPPSPQTSFETAAIQAGLEYGGGTPGPPLNRPGNNRWPALPPGVTKVYDLSIPEIEDRMRIWGGDEYVRDYMPRKYMNALGFPMVSYVRRPAAAAAASASSEADASQEAKDDLSEDSWEEAKTPFMEWQGRPGVNEGPGKFGENDLDDDDDLSSQLLFG